METKTRELIEPTIENLDKIFTKINEYAKTKGYQIKGEIKLPSNLFGKKKPVFKSICQKKRVCNYCSRLNVHVTMSQANRFLHLLFKHVYQKEVIPYIEYSNKELEIKQARKAWKKSHAEAQELLKKYKEVKGDFYKKQ